MSLFRSHFTKLAIGLSAILSATAPAHAALTFQFDFIPGTSAQAQAAFSAAGARWSSIFTDNINVRLTVGTASLGTGILAEAGSVRQSFSYNAFRSAMVADATSATDTKAVASLSTASAFGMLINRTSDSPNGAGSATPYLDSAGANNQTIRMTQANAKALGLSYTPSTLSSCNTNPCDGFIQFGTAFSWDYDANDGITAGAFDFTGIAAHEIGHALGFISGVDILDGNSASTFFQANQLTYVTPLDMFRYSADSASRGVIDFTADTRAKYFSLDKGVTVGAGMSTGVTWGDGRQASHFKDGLGLGIMDPTAGAGEMLSISQADITAFDAIGWNVVNTTPVPEPSTWTMIIAGFALIGRSMRRHRTVVSFA